MTSNHYDIIFTGGGAASRLLLSFLKKHQDFQHKSILFIEKENTTSNKTWCFWDQGDHPFQEIIKKSWSQIEFRNREFEKIQSIQPYSYSCIEGRDFDHYINEHIFSWFPDFTYLNLEVLSTKQAGNRWEIQTPESQFTADILVSNLPIKESPSVLKQQFLGWFVEFGTDTFDPDKALLMDFSSSRADEFSFFYILPFSKRKALIECTFYSSSRIDSNVYIKEIEAYIQNKLGTDYSLLSVELGSIPLNDPSFSQEMIHENLIRVGQQTGAIKASTGYAFQRMLDDAKALGKTFFDKIPQRRKSKKRHLFYDRLLLAMIKESPLEAKDAFARLFRTTTFPAILKFLDERTTLQEEARIFMHLKWWPFLKRIKFFK